MYMMPYCTTPVNTRRTASDRSTLRSLIRGRNTTKESSRRRHATMIGSIAVRLFLIRLNENAQNIDTKNR